MWNVSEAVTLKEIMFPKEGLVWYKYVGVISLMNFAYAMSMNLFPVYSGLRDKANTNMIKITSISATYASSLYILTGVVGIMMYGRTVGKDSNIINNVGYEYSQSDGVHWECFGLRIIFLIIYVFHLPPCFFPGKEAMLIIIDEIDRRSISQALDARVAMLKEEERSETLD